MSVSDSYYCIGSSHLVCEDYAAHTFISDADACKYLALAVVSDGCSASLDTDWGSRLLTKAAIQAFRVRLDEKNQLEHIVTQADRWLQTLFLPLETLDATLLVAQETPEGNGEVYVYGDGAVAARRRDGSGFDYWTVDFSQSAPSYPSYTLAPVRMAAYKDSGITKTIKFVSCTPEIPPEVIQEEAEPKKPLHLSLSNEVYDLILVFSDGVSSFRRPRLGQLEDIPVGEVLSHFMALKTENAGCIMRRAQRFFKKHCVVKEWDHYDDFSVAGILLDPPKEDTDLPPWDNAGSPVEPAGEEP